MSEQRYELLENNDKLQRGDQWRLESTGLWKEVKERSVGTRVAAWGSHIVFRRPIAPIPLDPLRAFIHESPHVDCDPAWKYRVTLPDATTRNYASEAEAMAALLAAIERTIGGEA